MGGSLAWNAIKSLAPWLLAAAVVAGVWFGGYHQGTVTVKDDWAAADKKRIKEESDALAGFRVAEAERLTRYEARMKGALNEKAKRIKELSAVADSINDRGLFVEPNKNNCWDSGTGSGPSGSDGAPSRQRLPDETSRDLISLAEEADQVVEQLLMCQDALAPLVVTKHPD